MAHVVVRKQELGAGHTQLAAHHGLDPQLVGDPALHGLAEDRQGPGEGRHGGQQHALELDEGFLVEHHEVHIVRGDASGLEYELDGQAREARIVLDAAEALLLGCGDENPIAHEGGR